MNVAKKSGLAEQIARFMQPLLRRLFRGVQKGDAVLESVSMNLVANLLGLGNAATPLGLRAMQQFQAANPNPSAASHNMIVFVVLNTAAMQLIPTTVATLRMSYGSAHPFEIIPATLLSSACSLTAALLAVKLMGWRDARHAD